MTTRELNSIEEMIKSETLCGKKLHLSRDQVREPELRRLVEDAIQSCHRSVDMLLGELRS